MCLLYSTLPDPSVASCQEAAEPGVLALAAQILCRHTLPPTAQAILLVYLTDTVGALWAHGEQSRGLTVLSSRMSTTRPLFGRRLCSSPRRIACSQPNQQRRAANTHLAQHPIAHKLPS